MTSRITVNPDPPVAGQSVTICYDFTDVVSTTIELEVSLNGSPIVTMVVTPQNPCFTIVLPASATSMLVEDLTDESPAWSGPVVQA